MLRTAFIGNENFYDRKICEWLSQHTDLSLVIWTNRMAWAGGSKEDRRRKAVERFRKRASKYGALRTADEIAYYVLYRTFLAPEENVKIRGLVDRLETRPRRPLSEIPQIKPDSIKSAEVREAVAAANLDVMFAMCIDVYLPKDLIDVPRKGTFLWHEGITPNYRGVYSPFWALCNDDHENLGYTLLRMNAQLDAGEVYVQGRAKEIDHARDWHSYIGHKAVLDSLPEVEQFLKQLESGEHRAVDRSAEEDGYYSYPTGSALLRLALKRTVAKYFGRLRSQ